MAGIARLTESPEYLYMFQKYEACREVIMKMGRWNKVAVDEDEWVFDKEYHIKKIRIGNEFSQENSYKESEVKC